MNFEAKQPNTEAIPFVEEKTRMIFFFLLSRRWSRLTWTLRLNSCWKTMRLEPLTFLNKLLMKGKLPSPYCLINRTAGKTLKEET